MRLTEWTSSSRAVLFLARSAASSSGLESKWSSIVLLPRPVTMMISVQPAATASSTPYWIRGLSTRQSISFGMALVAGRKRVPMPAAGKTALRIFMVIEEKPFRENVDWMRNANKLVWHYEDTFGLDAGGGAGVGNGRRVSLLGPIGGA